MAMPASLRERIVAEARAWIGTPWFHSGREKGIGCDCSGLLLGVWHTLGLTDWDFRRYQAGGDAKRLRAGLVRFCDPVQPRVALDHYASTAPPPHEVCWDLQPGDVLLLSIAGQPIHAGIATGAGSFIHAWEPGGVIEVPLDVHWRKRIVSSWRWRGESSQP